MKILVIEKVGLTNIIQLRTDNRHVRRGNC